ncbi:MAG: hypothetical protein CL925_17395 [Deltaproteobacteria bacterium]|nr:hypothetical protein [Deltaproteobacteria bacterium]MBP46159.1 hypothetical protein [Deltaproteobacteria bacterium]
MGGQEGASFVQCLSPFFCSSLIWCLPRFSCDFSSTWYIKQKIRQDIGVLTVDRPMTRGRIQHAERVSEKGAVCRGVKFWKR